MGNQQSSPPNPLQQSDTPPVTRADPNNWHLLVCNAYLIPGFMVDKNNASCKHQDERAAALGRVIVKSQPDIFMCQEFWGAGAGAFENAVAGKFAIGEYCRSWWGSTVVDSVLQYVNARGGLYFGNNLSTCVNALNLETSSNANAALKWGTFSTSKTKSKKGMVCVKYYQKQVSGGSGVGAVATTRGDEESAGGSSSTVNRRAVSHAPAVQAPKISTLLVFNTHLDPTNADNVQLTQLGDLAVFIRDVVYEQRALFPSQDFSAVVVGDFNFTATAPQYREMFKVMKNQGGVELVELLDETSKKTDSYSASNPLVGWPDSAGRIDHIFGIASVVTAGAAEKEEKSEGFSYQLKHVELISDVVRTDVLVSDHYPFEVVLKCEA